MRWMLGGILTILVFLGQADAATTYYVSKTGSGSICSQAAPCLTIAAGVAAMAGGDTLVVGNGTYAERLTSTIPSGPSATQRTTIRAENSRLAIIQPTSGVPLELDAEAEKNISIEGFVIDANNRPGVLAVHIGEQGMATPTSFVQLKDLEIKNVRDVNACVNTALGTHHIDLLNSAIHSCQYTSIPANPVGIHGLYWHSDDALIQGNEIYDVHGLGMQIYDAQARPISRVRVIDNYVHNYGVAGKGHPGILFGVVHSGEMAYNVVANSNSTVGIDTGSGSPVLVYNNTVYDVPTGIRTKTSRGVVRNNILYQTTTPIQRNTTGMVESNNLTSDPQFVDAPNGDFTPQAAAVIDDGTTDICTAADVQSADCNAVLTLTNYNGAAPDIGAVESGGTPPSEDVLAIDLGLNNALTNAGANGGSCTGNNVTFESATPTPLEGSHSALFDAASDYVSCATGALRATTMTVGVLVRADSFPRASNTIFAHNLSGAQRVWISATSGGVLQLRLDGDQIPTTQTLSAATWYHVELVIDGTQYTLYLNGTNVLNGSFPGLAQLGSEVRFGGFMDAQWGWQGNLDKARAWNYARTATQVLGDCGEFPPAGGCSGSSPSFVTPALGSNWTTNAAGTTWTGDLHATGPVDPAVVCETTGGVAANFTGVYSSGPQPVATGCTVGGNGKTGTIVFDVPPATDLTTITLQYKTDTPVSVTNAFNPPVVPNTGLSQASYQCRYPSDDDRALLWGQPTTSCRDVNATSPGRVAALMTVINDSGATLADFETGLVCKLNAGSEFRVGTDFGGNPVRFLSEACCGGLKDNTAFTTRQLLPTPAGKTFARRVVRRSDNEVPVDLENTKFIVNEWYLEIASGLTPGTDTLTCWNVMKDGTALASYGAADVAKAVIPIRRGRVVLHR